MSKKLNLLCLMFVSITFLISCGPKIYSDPQAENLAHGHKSFAVIPPLVSIAASKKIDAEAIKEQQRTESVNFQKEMYSWLLKRKQQGKIQADIQDVTTTVALLKKAGYYNGEIFTPLELAEILKVDGVLSSNYSLSKPMSQGTAIAVGVLLGGFGATNSTVIDLSLFDKATGKMIWNYNHKAAGSFTTPNALVDDLMRKASRKMPYSS